MPLGRVRPPPPASLAHHWRLWLRDRVCRGPGGSYPAGLRITLRVGTVRSYRLNATMEPGLPARMLNEVAYCPRLFYIEHVAGEWEESADTVSGTYATGEGREDIAMPERGPGRPEGEVGHGIESGRMHHREGRPDRRHRRRLDAGGPQARVDSRPEPRERGSLARGPRAGAGAGAYAWPISSCAARGPGGGAPRRERRPCRRPA